MASIPLTVGAVALGGGREVRATLCIERGRQVIDLREFAPFTAAGVLMPGRNGIIIDAHHLDELTDLLAEVVAGAKALGWLADADK